MLLVKRIFKTIYYLILAVIAVVAVFLILSVVPIKGGYKTLVVLSGSMEPKIHTGSIVAIKPEKEYNVGDVITFGENTKTKAPTTHRIFEIKDDNGTKTYTTKGDANNAPDQKPVTQSEIIGKVLFSVPYVGYGVAATQKPIGFMLIIIVPAVIIIYDEALNIKKEILKKMDYKRRAKKKEENKLEEDDEKTQEKI